jgi:hypothetical protein
MNETEFEEWDRVAYKLENGIKKLIESLQASERRENGTTASL